MRGKTKHEVGGSRQPPTQDREGEKEKQEGEGSSTYSSKLLKTTQSVHLSRVPIDVAIKLEEEFYEMKEQMRVMKNQFKVKVAQNLDDLVHSSDSSFTTQIVDYSLPPKFWIPQLEIFDELKDLIDWSPSKPLCIYKEYLKK